MSRGYMLCPKCGNTIYFMDGEIELPCDECGWNGESASGGRFYETSTGADSCDDPAFMSYVLLDVVAALGYATIADFRKNTCTS